jgi:signal transduction histidine kinase
MNHQVFLQFILPIGMRFGKVQLRNQEQFERMDNVVRSTLHSFKVQELNIYSMNNTISYSFDRQRIGVRAIGGTEMEKAKTGKPVSRLIQRGDFFEIMLGFPKQVQLVTFAPLRWEEPLGRITDPVLGIVEIVQNMSEDYQTVFRIQILVVITCTALMGALFLVLVFVVKRGEAIIEQRAAERLRLKEQLNRVERLSAMGEMAAGISHEIRNPLGIIRSSAELLKKKVAKIDPSNSLPDIIVEEATRLNGIITDFINFARPRNPSLIPCRIEEIIEKTVTFLAPQIEARGYSIRRSFANPLPEILADGSLLHQSFLNLFINAIQAMPEGGVVDIDIRAAGQRLEVRIEDEGPGIPDELLDKIWDPFFTTKDKGTGLGLGIVKNIIESHGGGIRILNRLPRGARVIIDLPLRQTEGRP